MLPLTHKLAACLRQDHPPYAIAAAYTRAIGQCGGRDDADFLLDICCRPDKLQNSLIFSSVLQAVMALDARHAAPVLYRLLDEGSLDDECRCALLEVLAAAAYPPVKKVLAETVFYGDKEDYYLQAACSLGLLNFDCAEYQHEIQTALESCYGKTLFPEYTPVLAARLDNPQRRAAALAALYELGEFCSTDCNGGIVRAFALCGGEGEPYFRRAVSDPSWECDNTGTGTLADTHFGMMSLRWPLADLARLARSAGDEEGRDHFARLIIQLLAFCLHAERGWHEPWLKLYKDFFLWRENGNAEPEIFVFADQLGGSWRERVYGIEDLLEYALREEILRQAEAAV
ncbi:MAG: hypothetical protein Q3966_01195 [Neisseria sp.]|nr:hypothetical protein [Neisseria sp.]